MKTKTFLLIISLLFLGNGKLLAQSWENGGNNLTEDGTLGTTSDFSLIFKTNDTEQGRVTNMGYWGLGTNTPQSRLHFTGDLTTNWGTAFYHFNATFSHNHQNKVWLRQNWAGGLGDYLMLNSSGNRSNELQSAVVLAEKGLFFGRGTDDGSGLSREWMRIDANGNVGIGLPNADHTATLTVRGTVHAQEVKISATAGADFVFEKDYHLRPLTQVAQYVKAHKHLPEIPSAAEMQAKGLNTGEFQIKLLQKVEELTLYLIAQEEKVKQLEAELQQLKQARQK